MPKRRNCHFGNLRRTFVTYRNINKEFVKKVHRDIAKSEKRNYLCIRKPQERWQSGRLHRS